MALNCHLLLEMAVVVRKSPRAFPSASRFIWSVCALAFLGFHATSDAAYYVGGKTKEVAVGQYRVPKSPRPVQMLFEIKSNGIQNANLTRLLWNQAFVQVENSGLFSEVSNRPIAGGALVTVVLDARNYDGEKVGSTNSSAPPADANTVATDSLRNDIFCTLKFYPAASKLPVQKESRQQIYFVSLFSEVPADAVRIGSNATSQQRAYESMLHQVISNVLSELSNDPAFYQGEFK